MLSSVQIDGCLSSRSLRYLRYTLRESLLSLLYVQHLSRKQTLEGGIFSGGLEHHAHLITSPLLFISFLFQVMLCFWCNRFDLARLRLLPLRPFSLFTAVFSSSSMPCTLTIPHAYTSQEAHFFLRLYLPSWIVYRLGWSYRDSLLSGSSFFFFFLTDTD